MVLTVLVVVSLIGLATWAAVEYSASRPQRAEVVERRAVAERQAGNAALETRNTPIRRNPANHIQLRLNRYRPARRQLEDAVATANRDLVGATETYNEFLQDFPGGSVPSRKWIILVQLLAAVWAAAFVAEWLLTFGVFNAVTGNVAAASLMTTVITSILAATAIGLAMLWHRRVERAVSPRLLRGGTVGLVTLFVALLIFVVLLAPKRAEINYADKIQTTQQSIAQFTEDVDQTAIDFANAKLDRLKGEREQAAQVYQELAGAAGALEFGGGLFLPAAILLLQYRRARDRVRSAVRHRDGAVAARARNEDLFLAALAQELDDAGVGQDQLQQGLQGIGPPRTVASGPGRGLPPGPAPHIGGEPSPRPDSVRQRSRRPGSEPGRRRSNDGADPSTATGADVFDQS
jgi:hypothetical protein